MPSPNFSHLSLRFFLFHRILKPRAIIRQGQIIGQTSPLRISRFFKRKTKPTTRMTIPKNIIKINTYFISFDLCFILPKTAFLRKRLKSAPHDRVRSNLFGRELSCSSILITFLANIKQSKELPPLTLISSLKPSISTQIYFAFYTGRRIWILLLFHKLQKIRLLVLAYCCSI
jgi:hypothetical protein